jgi:phage-related minor tail protein
MPVANDAVWLDVLPSMDKFGPALTKGAASEADKAGRTSGGRFGKGMLAGIAVVAGGAALATKALYNIGATFDTMSDTIRTGTGATGKALDALNASAKNVGKTTTASFEDIGTAVADVNTRLGLTGKPLEKMSTQFLELSRITGTDVAANIENVSRVFGDWGVEADKQSESLDYLFKVSQSTGIGIDSLSQKVVQFGAPMRQFGFSF